MRAKGGQGQNRDWSGSGWQERKGKGDWKENDRSEKREEGRQDRTGERERKGGEKSQGRARKTQCSVPNLH